MKTWITTLTAAEAVAIGACDGRCLVASKGACDCVCGGAYHGALAGSAIGEVTHTVRSPATSNVRRHKAPSTPRPARTLAGVETAARMLDLRAGGATVRKIAEQVGVGESTVRKRLREYTQTGSIPLPRNA